MSLFTIPLALFLHFILYKLSFVFFLASFECVLGIYAERRTANKVEKKNQPAKYAEAGECKLTWHCLPCSLAHTISLSISFSVSLSSLPLLTSDLAQDT